MWPGAAGRRHLGYIIMNNLSEARFQKPHGLRRGSVAVPLPGLRVHFPARCMNMCLWEFSVLSGTVVCIGLITRLDESYRLWCV